MKKAINFILFQAIWFACALGAATNIMYPALVLFVVSLLWNILPQNKNPLDLLFLTVLLPLGILLDSLWLNLELIVYKEQAPISFIAPYWIGILWVTFALSLNQSMQWLFNYPKTALIFGIIGGPLSYLGAEKLGAIIIDERPITLTVLAASWGLVILLILWLQRTASLISKKQLEALSHV